MENQFEQNNRDQVIKLTRDELMSSHVDDLLKRQMSLLGEPAISTNRRHWYYQNWFVFMIVGAIAALIAWAIIEPYFDDTYYIQGMIEEMDLRKYKPVYAPVAYKNVDFPFDGVGWLVIRGQKIWLSKWTKQLRSDGSKEIFDPSQLCMGEEVGVYIEYLEENFETLALAMFIVTSPPKNPPSKAFISLSRLYARNRAAGLLLFPLVAGLIGLAIGAVEGLICRMFWRALLSGFIGFLVGFIGGFVFINLAGLVYVPLNRLAIKDVGLYGGSLTAFGFVIQMTGRALAWTLVGMAMGLGQGIALRSKRLFFYGLLGGIIGGLIGGLLFDPIDLILLGINKPSSHWSRLIGLTIIGASVGAMIGVVERLARDAWLRMVEGPLAGKEFIIFKDVMKLGASPRSDIYLFNDSNVSSHHATLRVAGDGCEIENYSKEHPLLLNNRFVHRSRLRHGDRITIGRTAFIFEKREG